MIVVQVFGWSDFCESTLFEFTDVESKVVMTRFIQGLTGSQIDFNFGVELKKLQELIVYFQTLSSHELSSR